MNLFPTGLKKKHKPFSDVVRLQEVSAQVSLRNYVVNLWKVRSFVVALANENLRVRHDGARLGSFWNYLNPLLLACCYWFIFHVVLGASKGVPNYLAWLVIGIFVYRFTITCWQNSSVSVSSRKPLIRTIKFPRISLPTASIFAEVLTFRYELMILAIMSIGVNGGLRIQLVLLPAVLLMHILLLIGPSLFLARLNEDISDVARVLPFLFMIGRYLVGAAVPLERFEESSPLVFKVLSHDPLAIVIDAYRFCLLDSLNSVLSFGNVLVVVISSIVLTMLGLAWFWKGEGTYGHPTKR